MRIQSEYLSFNNCWTISSSYDFQVHLDHSRCTCSIPGAPAALPKMMLIPDSSTVIRGASRLVAGAPRLVTGTTRLLASTPRCTQSSLWRTEVFPNLSQSFSWYSSTTHCRSQLLQRPAGVPSYGPILFWTWCIQDYTPHPLRHFWRLPETKIHLADECDLFMVYRIPVQTMI
jgi:hypothetical protein